MNTTTTAPTKSTSPFEGTEIQDDPALQTGDNSGEELGELLDDSDPNATLSEEKTEEGLIDTLAEEIAQGEDDSDDLGDCGDDD